MAYQIGLIAERAAGKSELSKYFLDNYNIPSVRISSIIGKIGVELGLIDETQTQDKTSLQFVGNHLRKNYGEEFYIQRFADSVKNKDYLIDGIRKQKEIEILKSKLGESFITVGILADRESRFNRALGLGIVKDREDFEKQSSNPAEADIPAILESADYRIVNDGPMEDFHKRIKEFKERLDFI